MYDEKISERIRKGVKIDADFPANMVLAEKVIQKECGYASGIDYIHYGNQCDNQLTTVRYIQTKPLKDEKTGEWYNAKVFEVVSPDRYVPATEAPEGAIRSEEDV